MNCGNQKYGTGQAFPSSSVLFTGTLPAFITPESISCDANLDEILFKMNAKLQLLLDGNDFKDLDKKCFDFNPLTVTAKELHQKEIDKICTLESQLSILMDEVDGLNIGSKLINIDLHCLTPQAAPCLVGNNTYSLISILNLLVNEICLLKNP